MLKIWFFSSYQPISLTLSPTSIQKGASFVLFIPVSIIDPFTFYLGLFLNTVSILGLFLALLMTQKLSLGPFSLSAKPFNTLASIAAACYLHILYVCFILL